MSARRVRWTSSPSRSISALSLSFWSVSSCTFLSFSCSRSFLLFFPEKGEVSALPFFLLPRREEAGAGGGERGGEEEGEQLRDGDCDDEEDEEQDRDEFGTIGSSSSLTDGEAGGGFGG